MFVRIAAAIFMALLSSTAIAAPLYLTADRLVDVEASRIIAKAAVLIENDKIISVGTQSTLTMPAGARRIDMGNKTLVPGLIDMHVHLDSNPRYSGYTNLQFTDNFWAVQGVVNALAMVQTGFTTVRNVGSDRYNDVALKQAIDEGLIEGPRIVPAAYAIGSSGGHCDSTYFPPSMAQKSIGVGDGPEQLRQRVREQRKYGAEVIKICATGGVFSRGTEPGQQQLTEDEMRIIAEEAHMQGLRVAAHAHGASGIKAAIRAGVDTIEHASLIDAEGIKLAKERGTWLSMDIYNTDYTQSEGKKNGVLEDNLRKDREIGDLQRENFRKAHAAGVKMVFGSDAGVMPHSDAAKQLAVMVRYGMTPMQAIQAATRNAAEALGKSKSIGSIAAGHQADIIAVDGDPMRDVRALETIEFVMKGGIILKQENLHTQSLKLQAN
jgi:imidazolonepropionase-like amidohydrolase